MKGALFRLRSFLVLLAVCVLAVGNGTVHGESLRSVRYPEDVDRLCPPRPETRATFKLGVYPPAARSYRETAYKALAYMTSIPAMRTLVETGEPEQGYQHNAYVAKTHAAHILMMLTYARAEPSKREYALRFAKASAEYLLTQCEPDNAPLAGWPPTYGRVPLRCSDEDRAKNRTAMVGNEPEGAVKYRGEVMLLYPADVGVAFVAYARETKDMRFLTAAERIGETYLKTRRADGSWPLKMRLATGEPIGENTLVPNYPMSLFNALYEATDEVRWKDASDACFAWLEANPLSDFNWDGQFEDIRPCKPYENPTKHNAIDTMIEILRRYPNDPKRHIQCREILDFCERRFVCWEQPSNHPNWTDMPAVLEQYSCFVPIDASADKMIRGYLALWRVTKDPILLEKAKALGDTLTRVQKPNGRIPTFWTHDWISIPLYDWLNCMEYSASALLELAEATECPIRRGFYHVEHEEGRAWIVNPDGIRQCVLGVGHVPYSDAISTQLKKWGFNNLGGGGDPQFCGKGFSHTEFLGFEQVCYREDPDLYIRKATGGPMTALPNMFHPDFPKFCDELASRRCAPCREDRDLLGYFLDNELAWWGEGSLDEGLFDLVASLPETHSARLALTTFLAGRSVTHDLKVSFLRLAAERYFAATTEAVRKYDPNHLILGCRFAGMEGADDVVWRVAGQYCDVMSFNIYPFADLARGVVSCGRGERTMAEVFDHHARLSGKPLLISEWSFPALDTGRKCLRGAGQRLPTQKERVKAVELFVQTMLDAPQVVGYDFFKWMDQPIEGQAGPNPEDCNYGLVTEAGEPYAELVSVFSRLHADAVARHAESSFTTGVSYQNDEGFWTLANRAGVKLSGRLGGIPIASVVRKGYDYGSFGSMVEVYHPHTWLDAVEATDVSFARKGETGVLSVKAKTNMDAERACEVEIRFVLSPDAEDVMVELVRVRNLSEQRLRFVSAYLCPRSPGRSQVSVNEPTTVNHTPQAAYWLFPDGHRWGLVSDDPALGGMTFALDANDWPHADCRFVPIDRTLLEPQMFYEPPTPWRARILME